MTAETAEEMQFARDVQATALRTWAGRTVYNIDKVTGGPGNDKRAEWAHVALAHFAELTGADIKDEAIGDLLCNLHHWCDRNGVDFDLADERAAHNYQFETSVDGN